jgi:hypothetical protein
MRKDPGLRVQGVGIGAEWQAGVVRQALAAGVLLVAACGSSEERTASTCRPGQDCGYGRDASVGDVDFRDHSWGGGAGTSATGGVNGAGGSAGGDGDSREDRGGTSGAAGLDSGLADCGDAAGKLELCNGLDDDCDGAIDEDFDLASVATCGTCTNDCRSIGGTYAQLRCIPSPRPGLVPGTCNYSCPADFYDLDRKAENGCEYYCQWNPSGTVTIDVGGPSGCRIDNDCDGQVDEDVDTCSDVLNCGECSRRCVFVNGTGKCTTSARAGEACTVVNTRCVIDVCNPGYHDADLSPDNGCEYRCDLDVPPTEVCDGVDNDCDARIDNLDPDLEAQPGIGAACFGGLSGECAAPAHQGLSKCIDGQPTCCDPLSNEAPGAGSPSRGLRNNVCDVPTGPQVLRANEIDETCNGKDDDCDGVIDDLVCP